MRIGKRNLRRGAFGQPSVPFLLSRRGRTYSPPRRGGGIACGNRALCEADAASAEALWTMPHLCGFAVIVHAVGKGLPFWKPLFMGWYIAIPSYRLPAKICHWQFCRNYGQFPTAHFLFTKRNKIRTKGQ